MLGLIDISCAPAQRFFAEERIVELQAEAHQLREHAAQLEQAVAQAHTALSEAQASQGCDGCGLGRVGARAAEEGAACCLARARAHYQDSAQLQVADHQMPAHGMYVHTLQHAQTQLRHDECSLAGA